MKLKPLLLAASIIAIGTPAFAQTNWGSIGTITVALTLSYTDEALVMKDPTGKIIKVADGGGPAFENSYSVETLSGPDQIPVKTVSTTEYGSKISAAKWGNAEILRALVGTTEEEGILPKKGKSPFIAGWSLLAVYDGTGVLTSIVARHADGTVVDVPLAVATPEPPVASTKSEKTVMTDNMPLVGEPTSSSVHTFSESYKAIGSASVPFLAADVLEVRGLLTASLKLVSKTEGTGIDKMTTEVIVPGSVKLDKLLGASSMEDLVEGTISVTGGNVVNVDLYGATP